MGRLIFVTNVTTVVLLIISGKNMKFNWSIAHGSRISKIPFAPLRVIALFIRNIFVFVLLLKPDSRNARLVKKLYRDSAQLSLMYIDNARVKGDIGEFGSHGNLAAFIADFLGSEKSVRAYHVFDSFEGYPAEMTEVDAKSPHVKSGVWSPHSCVSPISSTSMLKVQKLP